MKKLSIIIISILMLLCFSITAFAEEDYREAAAAAAIEGLRRDRLLPIDKSNIDSFASVAYEVYNDDNLLVSAVYDGDIPVHYFFVKIENGVVKTDGSADTCDLNIGIEKLKSKLNVDDKDIKLFLTPEGVYASANGDTDNFYRVGFRMYGDGSIEYAEQSYTLNQLKTADSAMVREINENPYEMGGSLAVEDFMKPAFPIFGFVLIGVGLVALGLSVFLAVRAKKIGYGGKK